MFRNEIEKKLLIHITIFTIYRSNAANPESSNVLNATLKHTTNTIWVFMFEESINQLTFRKNTSAYIAVIQVFEGTIL